VSSRAPCVDSGRAATVPPPVLCQFARRPIDLRPPRVDSPSAALTRHLPTASASTHTAMTHVDSSARDADPLPHATSTRDADSAASIRAASLDLLQLRLYSVAIDLPHRLCSSAFDSSGPL
jgi:hypothetical protein